MGSKSTEDYLQSHMSGAPAEAVERMREFLAGRADGRALSSAADWHAALAGIQALVRAPSKESPEEESGFAEASDSPEEGPLSLPPADRAAELALVREWMGTGAGHSGRVFFGGDSRPPV